MARNVNEIFNALPAARRSKIEKMASSLIAEEMTLQKLRRARDITQVKMTKQFGIAQEQISEIEEHTDMYISAMRRSIKALGGKLSLTVEFPDRPPVALTGFSTGGFSSK